MKTVRYRITLLEPVLVTSLEGDPNSAVAYDYLPGSVLRGALISLAMRKNNGGLKIDDSEVRCRFFDGQTRFLNGYLVIDGKRSLPAPRTWEYDKYERIGKDENTAITDLAVSSPAEKDENTAITDLAVSSPAEKRVKAKTFDGYFGVWSEGNSGVYLKKAKHTISVHTERERKRGRSLGEENGTIYRYEALAADQTFEALILCENERDVDYFKGLIKQSPELAIGKARSAGYGRVQFTDVKTEDASASPEVAMPKVSQEIVLTLLSDVILRDENGQISPDVETFKRALSTALHTPNIEITAAYKGEGIVGGFNRKWGLPLPQMATITMGSVFKITLTGVSQEQLARLVQDGIGERRVEGFGRVAVGWQHVAEFKRLKEPTAEGKSPKIPLKLSEESQKIWARMQTRIERQKTDQDQVLTALGLKLNANGIPKSQLNRLRQRITSALINNKPYKTVITQFLEEIRGKKAEKHFDRASVDGKTMKEWLHQLSESSQGITKLDNYATLRLVDAVLSIAVKAAKK